MAVTLYSYWRSSASYRVRLALAWKRLDHHIIPVDLRQGAQTAADFRARNPQGLVPLLDIGGAALAQSLAIIEYLDEVHPDPPLLPADAIGRARVRAAAQVIACDIHPLGNLRVLRFLKEPLGHPDAEIEAWTRHWIEIGLTSLDQFAGEHGGSCLYGDSVTVADLCLLPQLYNARRFACDTSAFSRLVAIEDHLASYGHLAAAAPSAQPDVG